MISEDESPRLVGGHYAIGEEWRNSSRKNEVAEPKWKRTPFMDVSGGEHKVQCYERTILYRNLEC